jgi:hypothetical protein
MSFKDEFVKQIKENFLTELKDGLINLMPYAILGALIGSTFGSLFGIAISIPACVTLRILIKKLRKKFKKENPLS